MVMLVFWGASSPHFSDQKVVQHQTAIYQRAIFLNSTFFLWQFLKFWNPQQKYGGISLGSCVGSDLFLFFKSQRPSGDPVGKLPPVVQYSEPKPAIPWLRLALPSSTSAVEKPIRGDESGSSWRGEFFPCFFVGKYHQDKPQVYLRVLKNTVKNHMLLAMLCDRLSQGYNAMSISKKMLEVFCGFWDPTRNPQKMKERNCSLDNECDRGQTSLSMWMYPQSYIHLNHLRLHGISQALWEYSVVILFGLHFVPTNSMQSCHCSIYFRSKPIWCWVQIKSNPKLNSG